MPIIEEFPLVEESNLQAPSRVKQQDHKVPGEMEQPVPTESSKRNPALFALRYGTHLLAIAFLITIVWAMRNFYLNAGLLVAELPQQAALAAPADEISAGISQVEQDGIIQLPEFAGEFGIILGIPRFAMLHTTIPTRPRVSVITHTVVTGDSIFGIAEAYGLKPETIFWGNDEVLNDDPHQLYPGQVLNILPADGVYHHWSTGENLEKVAEFYDVEAAAIMEWPGNHFEDFPLDANGNPEIPAGTWIIIPGGKREFVNFGPPIITRDNPAVAKTYGPGHCGSVYSGALGSGAFIWPTTEGYLSGYDYNPFFHPGIDIAGDTGNSVWATDSGVVVYAGWSYSGYGNLVVVDHGLWQSLYAHLDSYYVGCGESVFQGTTIGALGSTGNSSGPHLHFELMYQGAKVNPWDYVSP